MQVIFTRGIPGSGKSTWSKDFCEKHKSWVRISRDDLRTMRGQYWLPEDESLISDWEIEMLVCALEHNKNVVIDATNFSKNWVKCLKEMARMVNKKVTFKTKRFNTCLKTCIKRDSKREKPVGEKVIIGMYNKHFKKDKK